MKPVRSIDDIKTEMDSLEEQIRLCRKRGDSHFRRAKRAPYGTIDNEISHREAQECYQEAGKYENQLYALRCLLQEKIAFNFRKKP